MKKKITKLLLVLTIIVTTSVAYSWWTINVFDEYKNIMNISQVSAQIESQTIQPQTYGRLIPISNIVGYGDTHEIIMDYNISLNKEVETSHRLFVDISKIKIGEIENPCDIVDISVDNPGIIHNAIVTVSVHISLDTADLTESDLTYVTGLLGQEQLSFSIVFDVVKI